jgi:hypothetical protein
MVVEYKSGVCRVPFERDAKCQKWMVKEGAYSREYLEALALVQCAKAD